MAAMCHGNRGIGFKMGLPWPSLKRDYDYYRSKTKTQRDKLTGKMIIHISGRMTWLSCPEEERCSPNVFRIVVSQQENESTLNHPTVMKVVPSFDAALEFIDSIHEKVDSVWVMGGNRIYKIAMEHRRCNKVYLTHVYTDFQADTFFPEFEDNFEEIKDHDEAGKIHEEKNVKFEFKVYWKKDNSYFG